MVSALVVAVTTSACQVLSVLPTGWSGTHLTRDGTDTVAATASDPGSVTLTAPASNRGENTRLMIWQDDAPAIPDSEVCATFDDSGYPAQAGVALRVTTGASTRAVTVTRNIAFFTTWVFNVSLWDTASTAALPAVLLDQHDLGASLRDRPLPWRLCARAVGDDVAVKVWPVAEPEPDWTAPQVGHTTLPPGSPTSGHAGLYAGHLPRLGRLTFSDVTTTAL